ncbi:MAG: hypothetical protein COA78_06635 [Blastopirellula sp.]|nr:MAG: hypothetical protein COA78_06635 [Blastopirellula sp.]
MSKRHEQKRLDDDLQLDQCLKTEAGRSQHWADLLGYCHADSMCSLLESTLHLPGDVIECGVYRGTSLRKIGRMISEISPDKELFACDSFAGFPEEKVGRIDVGWFRFLSRLRKKFQLADDTPARMEQFFSMYNIKGKIVKGFFSDTLQQFKQNSFCFIHVDCDIYESHIECLDELYQNLVPGGVAVFDDYGTKGWPGATVAVDEFFSSRDEAPSQSFDRETAAWYVRKPLASVQTSADLQRQAG